MRSNQLRQIPLLPPASLMTVGMIDMKSEKAQEEWWDKARAFYDKLSAKQKQYVDERWEAHRGPPHAVFYVYLCRSAAHSIPRI